MYGGSTWILKKMIHTGIFLITRIPCLDEQKIVGKLLYFQKYEESLHCFSRILEDGHTCIIEPLVYFLGEYWPSYAKFYFSLLRFSVLVIKNW